MTAPVVSDRRIRKLGIVLALYPHPDPTVSCEIWRAPDSSGSPDTGNDEAITVRPPGTRTYTDIIGGAGPYHYRFRHVRPNATASGYTDWVAAYPVLLPSVLPQVPSLAPWLIEVDRSSRAYSDTPPAGEELHAVEVPGGLLRGRGHLLIRIAADVTVNGPGTLQITISWGATSLTAIGNANPSSSGEWLIDLDVSNDGSTGSQVVAYRVTDPLQGAFSGSTTVTVDTTATADISIGINPPEAGDTATLTLTEVSLVETG